MTTRLSATGVACGALFHDVDLTLARGRTVALLGPSGVGKTTLLHVLMGERVPSAGRVDRAGRLGVVFQEDTLWGHLTARQHLELVGADASRAVALLEQSDLTPCADRRPAALSGGERRRLALARALAAQPDWLLLDEPMAHLDGPARARVLTLVRDAIASSGAGVLLATHHAGEALALADEVVVLQPGGVAARGTPEDVWRQPATLEVARLFGPAGRIDGAIVRAEEVRFEPDDDGADEVMMCVFVGPEWRLTVRHEGDVVPCAHARSVAPGTRGRLVRRAAPTDDRGRDG